MFRFHLIKRSFASIPFRSKQFVPTKKVTAPLLPHSAGHVVGKDGHAALCSFAAEGRVFGVLAPFHGIDIFTRRSRECTPFCPSARR